MHVCEPDENRTSSYHAEIRIHANSSASFGDVHLGNVHLGDLGLHNERCSSDCPYLRHVSSSSVQQITQRITPCDMWTKMLYRDKTLAV